MNECVCVPYEWIDTLDICEVLIFYCAYRTYTCLFSLIGKKTYEKKRKKVRLNHMIYMRPRSIGYLFSTIESYKMCVKLKVMVYVCIVNRKGELSSYGYLNENYLTTMKLVPMTFQIDKQSILLNDFNTCHLWWRKRLRILNVNIIVHIMTNTLSYVLDDIIRNRILSDNQLLLVWLLPNVFCIEFVSKCVMVITYSIKNIETKQASIVTIDKAKLFSLL